MNQVESELRMTPLAGSSGSVYKGEYANGELVFIKMNTPPILMALAREQIAPQVLWSKRQADGNTITAQKWLTGKLLTAEEMGKQQIIQILTRLHRSRPLRNQLSKLDYKIETPDRLLVDWLKSAPYPLQQNRYLCSIIAELERQLPPFRREHATIVHGDVHPNNWFETKSGLLYLIDWDSVRLMDRMFDVATILSRYIPENKWSRWLHDYGYKYNQLVLKKLDWYAQYSFLTQIARYYLLDKLEEMNREIYALRLFRSRHRDRA